MPDSKIISTIEDLVPGVSAHGFFLIMYQRTFGEVVIEIPEVFSDDHVPFKAYINWGRWCIDCDCGSSSLASRDFQFYICHERGCDRSADWSRVEFPIDVIEIEDVLLARPVRQNGLAVNRNWFVGETVSDLKKENTDRDLPEKVSPRAI